MLLEILMGEGRLKMLSSCDIKFIKQGCFCFLKRKQEHNLKLDMCLKSKELEHCTQPIPSNNHGKLLQRGLPQMLGTTTRPPPPEPAKSAEDDTLCRAFVTSPNSLQRTSLPGYHQQAKGVAWVSHGLWEVHDNAQAWVRRTMPTGCSQGEGGEAAKLLRSQGLWWPYQLFSFRQEIFDIREAEAGQRDELADHRHKLVPCLLNLGLLEVQLL